MELGGKSPCVIFADADPDQAIDSALFSLNGERCTAGSRILAERPVYHDLVTRLAARAERIRVGDPADPATEPETTWPRRCSPTSSRGCGSSARRSSARWCA
jgi:5-carboxymethyl-2-hydroxymuconic-semialdehyde dehydrogenase